jgi:hypothetical protein
MPCHRRFGAGVALHGFILAFVVATFATQATSHFAINADHYARYERTAAPAADIKQMTHHRKDFLRAVRKDWEATAPDPAANQAT